MEKVKKMFVNKKMNGNIFFVVIGVMVLVLSVAMMFVPLSKFSILNDRWGFDGDYEWNFTINGFSMLSNYNYPLHNYCSNYVFAMVSSYLIIVLVPAMVVVTIFALTVFRNKKAMPIMLLAVASVALFLALMYMIGGFIVNSNVCAYSDSERYYSYYYHDYHYAYIRTTYGYTLAYIPLILLSLCFVLELINAIKRIKAPVVVQFQKETESHLQFEQSNDIYNNCDRNTEALRKFKELLDMGAITQEEYDAKKKELLNL